MTFGPLIDQRPLIPNGGEDCLEACVGMCLGHLGKPYTMAAILAYHNGPTDLPTALATANHFGLNGTLAQGPLILSPNELAIALFHDNAYANPDLSGPFLHYSVIYAEDAVTVSVANPFGGRDITYPRNVFDAAYIGAILIPIKGEARMLSDIDLARAAIQGLYIQKYGLPGLEANYSDSWAANVAAGKATLPNAMQACAAALGLNGPVVNPSPVGGLTAAQVQDMIVAEVKKAFAAGSAGA